jgi:hypothetical protein
MTAPYTGGGQCEKIRYEIWAEPFMLATAKNAKNNLLAPLICPCPFLAMP